MLEKLKEKAKLIKRELTALYLAYRHPQVPWYAKLFVAIVIGYALSPIDLIPDFIPVLGYLDDLLLIPAGITLALRMIPKEIMEKCREQAADMDKGNIPGGKTAAVIVIAIWAFLIWVIIGRFF